MNQKKSDSLIEKVIAAQKMAYAPFSNFPVGAALETKSGKIFTGCNVENSSFSLTICAERVAVFKAISEGEREYVQIAIKADSEEFCSPCGACRQVLFDFAPNLKVLLLNSKNQIKEMTMRELLPEAFTKDVLKSAVSHEKEE